MLEATPVHHQATPELRIESAPPAPPLRRALSAGASPLLILSALVVAFAGSGCAPLSMRGNPGPSGTAATDSHLAAQIGLALYEAGIDNWQDIDVRVDDGVVELWGQIRNHHIKHRALEAARDVPGVVEVRDLLVAGRG